MTWTIPQPTALADFGSDHRPRRSFPFDAFRRLRFRTGAQCPHCHSTAIQRWGWFSGRRRYRCGACGRTFSDFTGTPLAYLKRIHDWPRFCRCVVHELTIRECAEHLGIDPATAFRWRHRLLAALENADRYAPLGVDVVVADAPFPYSEKGRRAPGHKNGQFVSSHHNGRTAWVVTARDRGGRTFSALNGLRRPTAADLSRTLGPKLRDTSRITSGVGRFGAPATAARRLGLQHRTVHRRSPELLTLRDDVARLRRWLRQFYGVATRYLDHYLAWHRTTVPRSPTEMFSLLIATSARPPT